MKDTMYTHILIGQVVITAIAIILLAAGVINSSLSLGIMLGAFGMTEAAMVIIHFGSK